MCSTMVMATTWRDTAPVVRGSLGHWAFRLLGAGGYLLAQCAMMYGIAWVWVNGCCNLRQCANATHAATSACIWGAVRCCRVWVEVGRVWYVLAICDAACGVIRTKNYRASSVYKCVHRKRCVQILGHLTYGAYVMSWDPDTAEFLDEGLH